MARGEGHATREPASGLVAGFAGLLVVAVLAAVTMREVLDIEAGATAYIVGEGRWSKAQQDAVQYLYRYSYTGDRVDLERAREALLVPIGDTSARLAMEREPIDEAGARAGLLQGRNPPENVERMIWMYRHFSEAPYFRDSVRIWREADKLIAELVGVANEIEVAVGAADAGRVEMLRQRLVEIDQALRPLEDAFSQALVEGSRWLRGVLLAAGTLVFLLTAGAAALLVRRAISRLRESERKFRASFRQAAVGMVQLASDGTVLDANDALAGILRRARNEVLGRPFDSLAVPEDAARMGALRERVREAPGQSLVVELRLQRRDGEAIWAKLTLSAIQARRARLRLLVIVEDISEARRLSEEMAHQASHDSLTGLINRREIHRCLEASLDSARRHGVEHALCLIDLDQFKLVNDTCGHAAGDELLCRVSERLQAQLRGSDVLGRLGGDEFAVVLDRTPLAGAERVAGKLNQALDALVFAWEGRSFSISASIGIVGIDSGTPDVTWLLKAADTACYVAKDEGRNRHRVYVESDRAMQQRRGQMEWVATIRSAIEARRLRLHAQRIAPVGGGGELSYELLVRLVDAEGVEHPPGAFLPAAERYDQAMAVDRCVVEMAMQALGAHPRHMARLAQCHINVSAQSLASEGFRAYVLEAMAHHRIPGGKLCFEITETAAIANLAEARRFIDAVRSRGCAVALDDFGSGLSSFAYLKSLPIDILKIDGVFVRDIASERLDRAIVASVVELARALDKRTIAEWVEDAGALQALRELGVDFAQGYGIHRPEPLEALMAGDEVALAAG